MGRRSGRRYDDTPKLNKKKVLATILTIIVIIMIGISLKNLILGENKTKDVSALLTYIAIYDNEKWGVIDNKGNEIIKAAYEEMVIVPDENEDLFICTYDVDYHNESYKTKVLNAEGEKILTDFEMVQAIENTNGQDVWYEENILKYRENGKYGLIDFEGKDVVEATYDNIYALEGVEKCLILEKDGKKGLINSKIGEIVIPVEYADVLGISESGEDGFIVKNQEGKYGVIGLDKSTILETKYDEIKRVTKNNYFAVVEAEKLEIVDKKGKVILDSGFDQVIDMQTDRFVVIKAGKYAVISDEGTEVIKANYEDIKYAFSNYYIAKKDGKYGIIDITENTVVGFDYENISYIASADFFKCEKENFTTDIYNRNLVKVLENVIVSELNTEIGYLRVRSGSDYKYYNFKFEEKTNKEVLATNTLFLVKENGKYGYDNKDGERIVDCIYDDAKEQNKFGYCAVNKNGKWGALKSDGTVVVEPVRDLNNYLYIDFISEWHRHNDLTFNAYTK